jgi:hypothetical protein
MEEQPNNADTVVSGMFISRITSDDDRQTSYNLNTVTDIEGFVVDTWSLVEDLGGVQIDGSSLIVNSKVGGSIRVSASNEKYVKKQQEIGNVVELTEVILTTKIFSFFFKVKEYKNLVRDNAKFFTNIGKAMSIVAGDSSSGRLFPGIDLPIKKRFNE